MHVMAGLRSWVGGFRTIYNQTHGIEFAASMVLYLLTILSITQWFHIAFGEVRPTGDKAAAGKTGSVSSWIDAYVFVVCCLSIIIFLVPTTFRAWVSTYFSVSTIIVLLNVVLLQRVFGAIPSPGRSLLLFIFNVVQIVFMFATWYALYKERAPLLTSVLTFATIECPKNLARIAMVQIATDFVLLAVYLSHLVSQFGRQDVAAR